MMLPIICSSSAWRAVSLPRTFSAAPRMQAPEDLAPVLEPPPGAFHPGIVCAVNRQLIVGYRYSRPSTPADRQAALDAGYTPIGEYSICQEAYAALPAEEQQTFERVAPPLEPVKLSLLAFAAALLLGAVGGVLSTGQFLDGSPNGLPPLDPLSDSEMLLDSGMPQLSPAEWLVALVFRPPGR